MNSKLNLNQYYIQFYRVPNLIIKCFKKIANFNRNLSITFEKNIIEESELEICSGNSNDFFRSVYEFVCQ